MSETQGRYTPYLGRWIVLEGGDGAGKDTQIGKLAEWIETQTGQAPVVTREPGGTAVGEAIRDVVLADHRGGMDPETELLLMMAARREHMAQVVLPALRAGRVVLANRGPDSSFAYQGHGRGVEIGRLIELHNWTLQGIEPDVVVVLDLDWQQASARRAARSDRDRFERAEMQFHRHVRTGYLRRAVQNPETHILQDASLRPDEVSGWLQYHLGPRLAAWGMRQGAATGA